MAVEPDAAPLPAGILALSPRLRLAALPLPADANLAGTALRSPEGELQGPHATLGLTLESGPLMLLIAAAQPGVEAGETLLLHGPESVLATFALQPAENIVALLPALEPDQLAILLAFIGNRALGGLRARNDQALAATCRDLARALPGQPPLARCGESLALWPLAEGDSRRGSVLVTAQGFSRPVSRSGQVLLLPAEAGETLLLPEGGTAVRRLLPANAATPALAVLVQQGESGAALHRLALSELAQAANALPAAREQLRALTLLAPAERPRVMAEPQAPVGGALELALDDHGGGLLVRGWLRDPMGLIESVALRSAFAEVPLPATARHAFIRADVAKTFAQAQHGPAVPKSGFIAWLAGATELPQAQWILRLQLRTGERLDLSSPPGLLSPAAARDALLTALPLPALTESILDECLVPAMRHIQAAFLAARQPPEVVRIGTPLASPALSIVVPLYRNLRFIRFQLPHLLRDPGLDEAEIIYVLDSPEQRPETEHLLRALHAVHQRPVTLVVQADNYGFASASNAGAAEARAPLLLMLNSDVIPAARGWLAPMLAALHSAPAVAAVGPKLLTEDGGVQHAGLFFERNGPFAEWFNNHYFKGAPRRFPPVNRARPVPGITGAAMLLARDRFFAVGGFGTEYAIGDYEDSDLCLKLRAAGGEILYEPAAELYHFERQSIREHLVHDRDLATACNRRLHHARWDATIEALMARPEFHPGMPG